MKTLWDFLLQTWGRLRPWVIIQPWQQALRTRMGKRHALLGPGAHHRIPVVDFVFVQSVRRRTSSLQMQSVWTADGKVASFAGSLSYVIHDLGLLYDTLDHAEDTLILESMIALAQEVRGRASTDCQQSAIEKAASDRLGFQRYGLAEVRLRLTDFAFVRAYRLVSDPRYGNHGDKLETSASWL